MKKLFLLVIGLFFIGSISYAIDCSPYQEAWQECEANTNNSDDCNEKFWEFKWCENAPNCISQYVAVERAMFDVDATSEELSSAEDALNRCKEWDYTAGGYNWWGWGDMGIDCDAGKLVNWQCKLNIYDTLWIRESVRDQWEETSVSVFIQDVVLSATYFIGTVVTIAIIVSGLMFVFAWANSSLKAKAKNGLIKALMGMIIVASSYAIIRLVQYIAKWW